MKQRDFTLNDFSDLFEEVKVELYNLGFKEVFTNNYQLMFFTSTHTFGKCAKIEHSRYKISLNKQYADCVTIDQIKNTLMHELIHSLKNTKGHTGKWKQVANLVNNKYGYHITRVAKSPKEFEETIQRKISKIKYTIVCKDCGQSYKYKRITNLIRLLQNNQSHRYFCSKCKSKAFELIEN